MRYHKEQEIRDFISEIHRASHHPTAVVHCRADKPVELLEEALEYIQLLENSLDRLQNRG